MTVIKKQVFRFLRWFNRPMRDEILSFRKDYEQLVGRYEALLKQISKYMKDHSFILNEEYKNSDDVWKQLNSVDSFMLQTIRGDLELITRDCEYLLEKGEQNPVDFPYQEELLTLHITQLKELRRYSDQIDNTLKDFEKAFDAGRRSDFKPNACQLAVPGLLSLKFLNLKRCRIFHELVDLRKDFNRVFQ